MQVLITGANGFIGSNLQLFLQETSDITIDTYDRTNTPSELETKLLAADFIVHLAGINRPQTPEEFFHGNTDLTKTIIDILNSHHLDTPLIFSSSIQAKLDNDYGKSKRLAEDYILQNYPSGIIYRLHNVFGKGCRPNYNSVVATFCNHIAKNEPITIDNGNKELELIYIDDICQTFIKIIKKQLQPQKPYNFISPIYKTTLSDLAGILYDFKSNLTSINVPNTGDSFIKKLFATFISYNSPDQLLYTPASNSDNRGAFTELIHTINSGQVSFSTSHPGVTRGNHYHHTKIEKFIVLQGQAIIRMRKITENTVHEFRINGSTPEIITIPVGYTHNITNIGTEDMLLLIWCSELFDKNNPDTFYKEV